jgi:methylenetetrahydrofolate reductase (NADPH)
MANPIREALTAGTFSYMVEIVASQSTTEEKLSQIGAELAQIPGVVAGGITSYAGGSAGHDPVRISQLVKEQGFTPNVHLTCVNKTRQEIRQALEQIHTLGIETIFAVTGDYPQGVDRKAAAPYPAPFDLDSVQLIEFINELREKGYPFYISCAVSPFKYTEGDCVWQYLKLEKKIKAGADFAITQLGYDVKKFRELKRYMEERGLSKTPVFGNVYVLAAKPAERMSKGSPPGCWVSQELLEKIQAETAASTDKGVAARLERAARTVAVLRGLGYAGAYLGGDHNASRIRWIIERSVELAPKWEELAEELQFAPKDGFYFFDTKPAPPKPRKASTKFFEAVTPTHVGGIGKGVARLVFGTIDKIPGAGHVLERAEVSIKSKEFGCQSCGNCVLANMEFVCPMTCPKNLRNGPCGGTLNGQCEVIDQQCIWVEVYDRAKAEARVDGLKTFIPARDRSLQNTSSWINFFLNRDSRPGNSKPLVEITLPEPPAPK